LTTTPSSSRKCDLISFRGFYSRKYFHDFHSRREYLQQILTQNMKTLELMKAHEVESREQALRDEEQRQLCSLKQLGGRLHHLVSTKSVDGVYNGIVTRNYKIGDMRVEDYLRQMKRINNRD